MTLKYESEILFDLMKRDGDDTPSDVLPYESELKEKYLNQVVGSYPKLQDYRPEWLNYNLEAHLPADFPVETLSNVTSATVDNVVPYAYKSAILKGQTLVNLSDIKIFSISGSDKTINGSITALIKTNTTYTRILVITKNTLTGANSTNGVGQTVGTNNTRYVDSKSVEIPLNFTGVIVNKTITTGSDLTKYNYFSGLRTYSVNTGGVLEGYEIILEGDYTDIDIPYFEGMQSVKMPGLTTTGFNLFDGVLANGRIGDSTGNVTSGNSPVHKHTKNFIKVEPNVNLCVYYESDGYAGISKAYFYDKNKNYLKLNQDISTISPTSTIITVPDNVNICYMKIRFFSADGNEVKPKNIIIAKTDNVITAYENYEYKTNILTVNEPVELRKVGNIQDELNLLTGELTKRIGEIVLDGSEGWTWYKETTNTIIVYTTNPLPNHLGVKYTNSQMVTNYLDVVGSIESDKDGCYISNTGKLNLAISKTKVTSVNELKQYLQSTPLVVQYLQTESVKTVDLNIQDQDGNTLRNIKPIEGTMHIHSDGTPVKPTITMEIPVEAITQNLASFIKEE